MEPSLYKAYQQATYIVINEGRQKQVEVDVYSIALDELLIEYQAQNAIFITAYNPRSVISSDAENQLRNSKLKSHLVQKGFRTLNGYSTDKAGSWPKEESFLVFELSQNRARELARAFEQNAYLNISLKRPVQLVFAK